MARRDGEVSRGDDLQALQLPARTPNGFVQELHAPECSAACPRAFCFDFLSYLEGYSWFCRNAVSSRS